jgi:hypothetical protein
MKLFPQLSNPAMVMAPDYDDGLVAHYTRREAEAENRKRRFLVLFGMRSLASRGEEYLIDGSMTMSDALWRCFAELIHEDAVFEAPAPDGSTQLVITRRGLDMLVEMTK